MTHTPTGPRLDSSGGAPALPASERALLDRAIHAYAGELRRVATVIGGIVEHHSVCDCGQENPDHDAVVLVVPAPYLDAFRKHLPAFLDQIHLDTHGPVPTVQGAHA